MDVARCRLEPLSAASPIARFECEDQEINDYIVSEALEDNLRGLARTFVELDIDKPVTENVAGFFTLRAHALTIECSHFEEFDESDDEDCEIEVPLVELMWLARDIKWKGSGVGPTLMWDAIRLANEVSERIGFIGMHLRTNQMGERLYREFDFRTFRAHNSSDAARYVLPIEDIRMMAESTKGLQI